MKKTLGDVIAGNRHTFILRGTDLVVALAMWLAFRRSPVDFFTRVQIAVRLHPASSRLQPHEIDALDHLVEFGCLIIRRVSSKAHVVEYRFEYRVSEAFMRAALERSCREVGRDGCLLWGYLSVNSEVRRYTLLIASMARQRLSMDTERVAAGVERLRSVRVLRVRFDVLTLRGMMPGGLLI